MDKFVYQRHDGIERTMVPFDKDSFGVHTSIQADEIVDSCKRDAELHDPRAVNKLLARVPLTIYEQSIREQWDEDDWKKWLNDPDNKAFRVWWGYV